MANNEENFEDMYSETDEQSESSGQSKRAAKKAANKAGEVLKKGWNASSVATKRAIIAALPYIGMAVLALVAIFTLISILVFIFAGPDMLMGQIVQMADELWTQLKTALVSLTQGDDYAQVTEQHVLDVAGYINKMGFNLVGYGFVGFKDKSEIQELKTDASGKVTAVESDLLTEYLAAENRTYMLSTVSISSLFRWWDGVNIFERYTGPQNSQGDGGNTGTAQNAEFGTGMLNVSTKIDAVPTIKIRKRNAATGEMEEIEMEWDKLKNEGTGENNNSNGSGGLLGASLKIEPEVDREKRKLTLNIIQTYNGREEKSKCVYNLEGWTGRYGKPIEFLLALHLGTMAPGFSEAIATRADFDTKVNIRLHKSVEYVQLTYKGYSLDDTMKMLQERKNEVWAWMKARNQQMMKPMYTEANAMEQAERDLGVTQNEIQEARKYEKQKTKEAYTPYIANVTNHWYYDEIKFKDLNTASTKDAYVVTRPSTEKSAYKKFEVTTYKTGEIYQVKEPETTFNEAFKKLFEQTNWQKVDGVSGTVSSNSKISITATGKITLGDDMERAVTMISKAAQNSDDAKLVLRDLKQWLEDNDFKFTDTYILTNKVTDDIDKNGTSSGSGSGLSSSGGSTTGSTTVEKSRLNNLLGGSTANIVYNGNDAVIKTSEMQAGTTVRSVVNGTVSKVSDNAVQIKISSPSNLKDKVMIVSGVQMDSGIKEGAIVSNNTPIAETVSGKDITIKMQDSARNSISVKDNLKY